MTKQMAHCFEMSALVVHPHVAFQTRDVIYECHAHNCASSV